MSSLFDCAINFRLHSLFLTKYLGIYIQRDHLILMMVHKERTEGWAKQTVQPKKQRRKEKCH